MKVKWQRGSNCVSMYVKVCWTEGGEASSEFCRSSDSLSFCNILTFGNVTQSRQSKQEPWTKCNIIRGRRVDLVTFANITCCYFLYPYISVLMHLKILLTSLQPPHWCTNSIPCWQKREHYTQKYKAIERSRVNCCFVFWHHIKNMSGKNAAALNCSRKYLMNTAGLVDELTGRIVI